MVMWKIKTIGKDVKKQGVRITGTSIAVSDGVRNKCTEQVDLSYRSTARRKNKERKDFFVLFCFILKLEPEMSKTALLSSHSPCRSPRSHAAHTLGRYLNQLLFLIYKFIMYYTV